MYGNNLLEETVHAIIESGHAPDEIAFIGSEESGHSCTWKEFREIADVTYDDGFGAAQVATDLIIVFNDGQRMWRGEYDGSEWWEYGTPFTPPEDKKEVKRVVGAYWPSLENLQDDTDTHHNPGIEDE